MNPEQQYIDFFTQNQTAICAHSAEALNAFRMCAFKDFNRLGFPTKQDENYRYTDIASLFSPNYGLNINRLNVPINPHEVFKCEVPNMSTNLCFVVNDIFYEMEAAKTIPEGMIVGSLNKMAKVYPDLIKKYYGRIADTSKDVLTAFNTMWVQDGLFVYVPKDVVIDKPLQLINILRGNVDWMVNRRILIVLEENASLKLLACDHAMDFVRFLATQVIEVYVGKNSVFDLYELEETQTQTIRISNLYVRQEADSNVMINGITLNNGTTRNRTEVLLEGEGAEINLYGMVVADKNQHVDNSTFINHKVPHCSSDELYKYVLEDEAQGAFSGKVLVCKNAQKTISQQTNKNLCMTRTARMFTQPQLEIYADDVKCSHGASVGQLDENALFYMCQRGIPEKEARLLLMFAFVNDVIDHVRIESLKDRLLFLVEKRFRGKLNKCANCAMCK